MIELAVVATIWLGNPRYRPQVECAREWSEVRRSLPFEPIADMRAKYRGFMRACADDHRRT